MDSDRVRRKPSQFSRDQTSGRSISKVKTVFLLEYSLFLTCRTCFRSTNSWLNQHTLRTSPRLKTLFLDQHLFLSRETRQMYLKLTTPFFDDCASSPGSRQQSLLIFATLIFYHENTTVICKVATCPSATGLLTICSYQGNPRLIRTNGSHSLRAAQQIREFTVLDVDSRVLHGLFRMFDHRTRRNCQSLAIGNQINDIVTY